MGSVIDYIECPNCGHEAFSDFYYKTGEEYVNCNNCGYHYSATIKNVNKKLNELTEDDWKIYEVKNPYGSFRVQFKDSIGYTCGSLSTEQDANDFKADMLSKKGEDVEYVSISRLVDGEIIVETLNKNTHTWEKLKMKTINEDR